MVQASQSRNLSSWVLKLCVFPPDAIDISFSQKVWVITLVGDVENPCRNLRGQPTVPSLLIHATLVLFKPFVSRLCSSLS